MAAFSKSCSQTALALWSAPGPPSLEAPSPCPKPQPFSPAFPSSPSLCSSESPPTLPSVLPSPTHPQGPVLFHPVQDTIPVPSFLPDSGLTHRLEIWEPGRILRGCHAK